MRKLYFLGFVFFILCTSNIRAQTVEFRNKHQSKGVRYANQMARKLMKKECPNTGHSSYAKVKKVIYDEYNGGYEIHMEAYWTGRSWVGGDSRTFNIDGILKTSFNGGRSSFKATYINQAVKDGRENDADWGVAVVGTAIIIELSKE